MASIPRTESQAREHTGLRPEIQRSIAARIYFDEAAALDIGDAVRQEVATVLEKADNLECEVVS